MKEILKTYGIYIALGIAAIYILSKLFTAVEKTIEKVTGSSETEQKQDLSLTELFTFPTWVKSSAWVSKNYPEIINPKTKKIDTPIISEVESIFVNYKNAGNSIDRDEARMVSELSKLKSRGKRALFMKYVNDSKFPFFDDITSNLNEAEKARLLNSIK